jgi:ribosomal protein S12 methylthiotransferase accessory factor YcaO
MPKLSVTLIETLIHRVVVEAVTEAAAMRTAEISLTETDQNDEYLFVTSRYHAIHTEAATVDAQPSVKDDEALHAD